MRITTRSDILRVIDKIKTLLKGVIQALSPTSLLLNSEVNVSVDQNARLKNTADVMSP